VLLLLEEFGESVSTRTKLGIDVATLEGLGFRGDDFGSRIFTPELRFTALLCLLGGADATKERPRRFSGMVCSAVVGEVFGCHVDRWAAHLVGGSWDRCHRCNSIGWRKPCWFQEGFDWLVEINGDRLSFLLEYHWMGFRSVI